MCSKLVGWCLTNWHHIRIVVCTLKICNWNHASGVRRQFLATCFSNRRFNLDSKHQAWNYYYQMQTNFLWCQSLVMNFLCHEIPKSILSLQFARQIKSWANGGNVKCCGNQKSSPFSFRLIQKYMYLSVPLLWFECPTNFNNWHLLSWKCT